MVRGTPSVFAGGRAVFVYNSKLMKFKNDQRQLRIQKGSRKGNLTKKGEKIINKVLIGN